MMTKSILEEILKYNELKESPIYEEDDPLHDQIKKAIKILRRYDNYFEMRKLLKELGERESDIHIVSYAKSGTTLTQMMLYQMTTEGLMNFEHLYDVSPWPGWALEYDLEIKDLTPRRIFKSHDPYIYYEHVKKGKFIFLIRNVFDVFNSFYHHRKDYYQRKEEYEKWVLSSLEYWYKYNEGWLRNKRGLEILYLNYEDTIANKESQIDRISEFIGIELSKEKKKQVIEKSSFKFMKSHEEKFGEQPNKEKVYNNFIRKGEVGEGLKLLTKEIKEKSDELAEGFYKEHKVTRRYYE